MLQCSTAASLLTLIALTTPGMNILYILCMLIVTTLQEDGEDHATESASFKYSKEGSWATFQEEIEQAVKGYTPCQSEESSLTEDCSCHSNVIVWNEVCTFYFHCFGKRAVLPPA